MDRFNNQIAGKVASDKQTRFGCKGKQKYWFGYKEHVPVDVQSDLINKAAATSADVTDAYGHRRVCHHWWRCLCRQGIRYKTCGNSVEAKGCHDATIKRNNMKEKNRKKDRSLSAIRAPYERVFAHRNKKVRYGGLMKVQFQWVSVRWCSISNGL